MLYYIISYMSYRIISYHHVSYIYIYITYRISYHIIYHIPYHIIYHVMSYHIYHIISYIISCHIISYFPLNAGVSLAFSNLVTAIFFQISTETKANLNHFSLTLIGFVLENYLKLLGLYCHHSFPNSSYFVLYLPL